MRPILDLSKERPFSLIKLRDKKEYRIPKEFTVEEVERLLEQAAEQERIEKEPVIPAMKDIQIGTLYEAVFAQIEIMFQHYQPDMTREYLRKVITHNEALEMVGFFTKYRSSILASAKNAGSKKKVSLASTELRELRRLLTFMVVNGFSLFDLKHLYIDELYDYYEELVYTLEHMGKMEEGTYDRMMGAKREEKAEDVVASLRRQMLKSLTPQKKDGRK